LLNDLVDQGQRGIINANLVFGTGLEPSNESLSVKKIAAFGTKLKKRRGSYFVSAILVHLRFVFDKAFFDKIALLVSKKSKK
jgi:hypothetical protein